jgi:hypothetical protein
MHQLPGVSAIRPDEAQSHQRMFEEGQHELTAVAVLHVGRVHHHGDQQPERIDQEVSLATIDLFARIVTMGAPLSVVFTDWLSITAALGCRSRPTDSRTSPWSRS